MTTPAPSDHRPNRPRDLALLLLACDGGPPRQRARDQQADLAGADLRRRVLDRLAAIDPEPNQLNEALAGIIDAIGPPTGPTRGVCTSIRQDWDSCQLAPAAWACLLAEAIEAGNRPGGRRQNPKRRGDGHAP